MRGCVTAISSLPRNCADADSGNSNATAVAAKRVRFMLLFLWSRPAHAGPFDFDGLCSCRPSHAPLMDGLSSSGALGCVALFDDLSLCTVAVPAWQRQSRVCKCDPL